MAMDVFACYVDLFFPPSQTRLLTDLTIRNTVVVF